MFHILLESVLVLDKAFRAHLISFAYSTISTVQSVAGGIVVKTTLCQNDPRNNWSKHP